MNLDPETIRQVNTILDRRSVLRNEKSARIPCGGSTDRKVRFDPEPQDNVWKVRAARAAKRAASE